MYVSLKTTTLLVAALLSFSSLFAQSKQEVFSGIQKLVNKAVGEKLKGNNLFSKDPDKLTRQIFNEQEVTVYRKPSGKKDYQWVTRGTNIPWNDFFDYDIYTEFENSDVQIVRLNFNKSYRREYFASDDGSDDDPSTSSSLEVYVLTKDKKETEQLLKRLYELREKKAAPAFVQEVKRYTKEQTLDWLNQNLRKYIRLGSYDTEGKIVSLDACKLVVSYRSLVRSYEEVLPTNIKGLNKYGKLEYSSAAASIRTTTPDSFDKGEKKYANYSSAVHISNNDEDMLLSIEAAFKQLATFCNGTSSTTTTTPAPPVIAGNSGSSGISSSSSSYAAKDAGAQDQWYLYFSKGKNMGLQKWVTSETDFPTQKIDENWKLDYYITDVAYAGTERKWFLAFSKTTAYTDQVWRKRDTRKEVMAAIDDIWKLNKGLHITNLLYANNAWVAVATKGTAAKDQIYMYENSFPEEKIKTYWGKGYDITDMAYSPDGWLIIMTQGYNYTQRYKKLETSNPWNHQMIIDYKNEGYYLSQVCKAGSTWYMLFNKDAKVTAAEYQTTDRFNPRSIDEMWKTSFSIDKLIYVPAR